MNNTKLITALEEVIKELKKQSATPSDRQQICVTLPRSGGHIPNFVRPTMFTVTLHNCWITQIDNSSMTVVADTYGISLK